MPPAVYAKLSASGMQRDGSLELLPGLRAPSRCTTEPVGSNQERALQSNWMKEGAQVTHHQEDYELMVKIAEERAKDSRFERVYLVGDLHSKFCRQVK